nr:vacuolar cation/proton exchanger 3-like isoform X2 [Physcomitrium patens]|eukprot:XP_024394970.1 vacuolar cation/proton exchanger 3-like isoform X2 [Physcomitrella patens]
MKDFQKVTTSDNKDLELMALREGVPQHSDSILYKSNNCTNELVRPPMQSCCITTFSLGSWICKFPAHLCGRMCPVLFGTKLNCLLLCVPFAVIGVSFGILGHSWVFLLSLLGMMPLAERLGFVTEQLSCCTGATVGGLLNATFGNATEVIICVMALRKNMIRVVQLSLLGSILSNMLLVLGCAFFFGGLKHPQTDQKFNKVTAQVSASLLLMAVMGLLFPVVLHATGTELQMGKSELVLSRFSSIVMLVAYIAYLYFQLKSHKELYDSEEDCGGNDAVSDDDEAVLDFWTSIAWLTVLTIFISILSEYLVDAIEVYDGLISSLNFKLSFVCYSSKLSCGRVIQYALRNGNLDLGATKRFAWTISVHVMLQSMQAPLCLLSKISWIFRLEWPSVLPLRSPCS